MTRRRYGCQDGAGGPRLPANFETLFRSNQSPIGGGVWVNNGVLWTQVDTSYTDGDPNGIAFGTQGNSGAYDDSYAHLDAAVIPFGPNQRVGGRVSITGAHSGYMEIELWLRCRDSAGQCTVVECNFAWDGQYAEIIGWPGPLSTNIGDFQFFSSGNPFGGFSDGDTVEAQIVGDVVQTWINGVPHASASIAASTVDYSSGQPGLGYYRAGGTAMQNFCFSRWWAYEL